MLVPRSDLVEGPRPMEGDLIVTAVIFYFYFFKFVVNMTALN